MATRLLFGFLGLVATSSSECRDRDTECIVGLAAESEQIKVHLLQKKVAQQRVKVAKMIDGLIEGNASTLPGRSEEPIKENVSAAAAHNAFILPSTNAAGSTMRNRTESRYAMVTNDKQTKKDPIANDKDGLYDKPTQLRVDLYSASDNPQNLFDKMLAARSVIVAYLWFIALGMLRGFVRGCALPKVAGLDTAALGGVRAILALWVTLEHSGLCNMAGAGSAFLVLSGCTVTASRMKDGLVKDKDRIITISDYLKFVFVRLTRILPLYWFAVATKSVLYDSSSNPLGSCYQMVRNIFLLPVEHPKEMLLVGPEVFWFVQVVTVMYLLMPLFERILLGPDLHQPAPTCRLLAWAGIATAVKFVEYGLWVHKLVDPESTAVGQWTVGGVDMKRNPIVRIPDFILGMLVPHLVWKRNGRKEETTNSTHQGGEAQEVLKNTEARTLVGAGPYVTDTAFLLMMIYVLLGPQNIFCWGAAVLGAQSPLIAAFLWGLCFGPRPSPMSNFLSNPTILWIGECGYGVYLYQDVLLHLGLSLQRWDPCSQSCSGLDLFRWFLIPGKGMLASEFCAVGIILILARCSYELIEDPCSRAAKRILALDWFR
jgi:peptidoglycan/LPS O-acetylase OafA/YrhL